MSLTRILKDPLFHFVVIGAVLFAAYAKLNPESEQSPENSIFVSRGRIEQLAAIFAKTSQRPVTREDLKSLIDDYILEVAYSRKAIEMGIDQDDTMIRRRLRQKLVFLTDDTIAQVTPSDEELERYRVENIEKFQTDSAYTFQHKYFNPSDHGDDPFSKIQNIAISLRVGDEVFGDPTLLPESFEDTNTRIINRTFGHDFSSKISDLTVGEWSDPVTSTYGLHLIFIERVTPGESPPLEQIRPIVEREWANDLKDKARRTFDTELLKDYVIEVEWPEPEDENG